MVNNTLISKILGRFISNPSLLWLVLALLRGNALHSPEAPGQHGGGWEKGPAQTQAPPAAKNQRILVNGPKPQGHRWGISFQSNVGSLWCEINRDNRDNSVIQYNPFTDQLTNFFPSGDFTLNFRNNETPSLLGILKGKKYHPALYVRYKNSKTKNTWNTDTWKEMESF